MEDSTTKQQLGFEKDAALRDQKSVFIEQESKRLSLRFEEIYADNKELSKRLQECESELKQADLQLKLTEEEKRKEVELMK